LRIIKLGRRVGDGAEMAIIEFVGNEEKKIKVKKDARWIAKPFAKEPKGVLASIIFSLQPNRRKCGWGFCFIRLFLTTLL